MQHLCVNGFQCYWHSPPLPAQVCFETPLKFSVYRDPVWVIDPLDVKCKVVYLRSPFNQVIPTWPLITQACLFYIYTLTCAKTCVLKLRLIRRLFGLKSDYMMSLNSMCSQWSGSLCTLECLGSTYCRSLDVSHWNDAAEAPDGGRSQAPQQPEETTRGTQRIEHAQHAQHESQVNADKSNPSSELKFSSV